MKVTTLIVRARISRIILFFSNQVLCLACDTTVNISLSFGGSSWPISDADFNLRQMSGGQCLGAFFALDTGSGTPPWIVGDTFLVRSLSLRYIRYTSDSLPIEKRLFCFPLLPSLCRLCPALGNCIVTKRCARQPRYSDHCQYCCYGSCYRSWEFRP